MMEAPTWNTSAVDTALARVPSPRISPMRQALAFGNDQYRFLDEHSRALGDVFLFRIPGEPTRVVLGHPQDIKKVFALRPEDYYSGDPGLHVNFGESCVLFNDGERHRRDRQLLTPPLHGEALKSYASLISRATTDVIDRWKVGDEIVLHDAMTTITLRVITSCIFGALDPAREARLRDLAREWLEITLSPAMFAVGAMVGLNRMRRYLERRTDVMLGTGWAKWVPMPAQRSVRLKAELIALLTEEVERSRDANDDGRTDVLALVARARHEDGTPMDTRTIVDQLTLLMAAGHETTAKSMCWLVLDLLQRPHWLAEIRAEIARVFGDGAIDPAKCRELTTLQAVLKESMRLTPVTTALQRQITRPMVIAGHTIPAGAVLAPSNYLAQRHASAWDEPLAFRPQRFAARTPAPYEYFPFGGGRRRCLGVELAMFEMPIVLAHLLRSVDLALARDTKPAPRYSGVTIGPADGLRVVVSGIRGT